MAVDAMTAARDALARMGQVTDISEMGHDERVFMLGVLTGSLRDAMHGWAQTADLSWLVGAAHDVTIGACNHDGGAGVYVSLAWDEPREFRDGTLPGALAQARAWSEGEGITP